jgi:hypothetical protein
LERWAEYVEQFYEDKSRGVKDLSDLVNEEWTIGSDDIRTIINALPKEKACGTDNILAELLQNMGEEGLKIITKMINMI